MMKTLDRAVGACGFLGAAAVFYSRPHVVAKDPQLVQQCLITGTMYLLLLLGSCLQPFLYRKHRTAIIVCVKVVGLLLPGRKAQVRLRQAATGRPGRDTFDALMGLRLPSQFLYGLLSLPWFLWLVLQVGYVAMVFNLDEDCSLPFLSHMSMAKRISKLHGALAFAALPLLPQARQIVPKTQLGQCKAAVAFWSILCGLVIPGVCLVAAPVCVIPSRRWSHNLRLHAHRCLRVLQNHRGLLQSAKAWWMLLVVLWAASTLPY